MNKIICGNALEVLPGLPEQSIHCTVTSPPYWALRDYGLAPVTWADGWVGSLGLEPTPEMYIEHMRELFRKIWPVLRDDGTLWMNLGDCYNSPTPGARDSQRWPKQSRNDHHPTERPQSRKIKSKDLVGIPWRVALALQEDGWYLRSDIIWCLSGGARIYAKTQKGEMPMMVKDMVRLRPKTVKLWNGKKWTQVLGWSRAKSRSDGLEIEFRSGERVGCTIGHKWPTERGVVRADELKNGDIIGTCRLPECNKNNPDSLNYIIGWYVGHYLAEGSRSGDTIQIACHAKESDKILKKWRCLSEGYGGTARYHKTSKNGGTICVESKIVWAILDRYISGRTSKNKGLKVSTWQHNDQFLNYLLEGYLYGDGHWEKKNQRWCIGFTRNDKLAADLRTLCARLGWQIRLRTAWAICDGNRYPSYRGEIRSRISQHFNTKMNGEVITIRKSRARQFWDIGVEDEPHTFALASGLLTHNSKPNPMPESVKDRPTKAHEYLFLLTKREKYFYDAFAVREEVTGGAHDRGIGLNPKAKDAPKGGPKIKQNTSFAAACSGMVATRNKRSVWTIPTQPYKGAHYATFPEELVIPCIKAGTSEHGACDKCGSPFKRLLEKLPASKVDVAGWDTEKGTHGREKRRGAKWDEVGKQDAGRRMLENTREARIEGGDHDNPFLGSRTVGWKQTCECSDATPEPCVVMDIFGGSGTVGLVGSKLGRRWILIDQSPESCGLARKRIRDAAPLLADIEEGR